MSSSAAGSAGYRGEHGPTNEDGANQNPLKLQLTKEEKQVLDECNKESFWYRCVPLSVLFIGTSQILVKRGILKPHPKYGALLKNLGAALVAFMVGKASYQGTCREKIMRLENSPLAEAMRRGVRGTSLIQEMTGPQVFSREQQAMPVDDSSRLSDEYNSGDSDVAQDQMKTDAGLDDSKRPNIDADTKRLSTKQPASEQAFVSYDDLRRQNRDGFDRKMAVVRSPVQPSDGRQREPLEAPPAPPLGESPRRQKRNQWGDVIDE